MSRHNPLKNTSRTKRLNRRFPLREILCVLAVLGIAAALFFIIKGATKTTPPPTSADTTAETTDRSVTDAQDSGTASESQAPTYNTAALRSAAEQCFKDASFSAKHVVVYDADAETVLFEKAADDPITAASTTKLLTALTAFDYVTADSLFTVGSELDLVGSNSSTAGLKKGQTLTAEQILDAMILPSGNDAAYVIAVHVGRTLTGDPEGSDQEALEEFLRKMNEKAASLGAANSLFTCPDGYPGGNQHTTAADMMKIAAAALKNPDIAASCKKIYASYQQNDGTALEFTTTNQLILPSSPYYYEGAIGMKTGYTGSAGQCVIGAAKVNGRTVIAAIYNAPTSDDRWKDCRNAFGLAFDAIQEAKNGN